MPGMTFFERKTEKETACQARTKNRPKKKKIFLKKTETRVANQRSPVTINHAGRAMVARPQAQAQAKGTQAMTTTAQAQATKCPPVNSRDFTAAINGPPQGTKVEIAAAAATIAVAFGIDTAGGWADMRSMPKAELLAYATREIYAPAKAAAQAALAKAEAAHAAEVAAGAACPRFTAAKAALLAGLGDHTRKAAGVLEAFRARVAAEEYYAVAYEVIWRAEGVAAAGKVLREFGPFIAFVWRELEAPSKTPAEFAEALAGQAAQAARACMRREPGASMESRAEFMAEQEYGRALAAAAEAWPRAMAEDEKTAFSGRFYLANLVD